MSEVVYVQPIRFPGYRVGSDGSVWSVRGKSGKADAPPHRLIPQQRGRAGKEYLYVSLYKDRKRIQINVHKLVLETFIGPCPDGLECRHLNGDRFDNSIVNLAWGTKSDNTQDQIDHGTFSCNLPGAKVDAELSERMDSLRRGGMSRNDIAAAIGVSRGTVWRHLGSAERGENGRWK